MSWESNLRTPLPGSDGNGVGPSVDFGDFTCEDVKVASFEGASGIVYTARSDDYYGSGGPAARLVLKECYPVDLAPWIGRAGCEVRVEEPSPCHVPKAFELERCKMEESFRIHASLYQGPLRECSTVPRRPYEANGTTYLVSDASDGAVLSRAVAGMPADVQVRTLVRICEALSALHEEGYAYLDLKPANVLAVKSADPDSECAFTGEVKLFDFGSVARVEDLKAGRVPVCGSGDWSAYEQSHAASPTALGETCDIYAVGAMLFWMLVGRPPTVAEVAHAYGEWKLDAADISSPAFSGMGAAGIEAVNDILGKTLVVDLAQRYASAKALKKGLQELGGLLMPKTETMEELFRGYEEKMVATIESRLSDARIARLLRAEGESLFEASHLSIAARGTEPGPGANGRHGEIIIEDEGLIWLEPDAGADDSSVGLLKGGQRALLACLALLPECGLPKAALLEWAGLEGEGDALDRLSRAGFAETDVTGERVRLSRCLDKHKAFSGRPDDEAVDRYELSLWERYCPRDLGLEEGAMQAGAVLATSVAEIDNRPRSRSFSLAHKACLMAGMGEEDPARAVLGESLSILESEEMERAWRGRILSVAGQVLVDLIDDPEGALPLLLGALDELEGCGAGFAGDRLWATGAIGAAYAKVGDCDKASERLLRCATEAAGGADRRAATYSIMNLLLEVPAEYWEAGSSDLAGMLTSGAASAPLSGSLDDFLWLDAAAKMLSRRGSEAEAEAVRRRGVELAMRTGFPKSISVNHLFFICEYHALSGRQETFDDLLRELRERCEQGFLETEDAETLFFLIGCGILDSSADGLDKTSWISSLLELADEAGVPTDERLSGFAAIICEGNPYAGAEEPCFELLARRREELAEGEGHAGELIGAINSAVCALVDGGVSARVFDVVEENLSFLRHLQERRGGLFEPPSECDALSRAPYLSTLANGSTLLETQMHYSFAYKVSRGADESCEDLAGMERELSWLAHQLVEPGAKLPEEELGHYYGKEYVARLYERAAHYSALEKDWADVILMAGDAMGYAKENQAELIGEDSEAPFNLAFYVSRALSETGDGEGALEAGAFAMNYLDGLRRSRAGETALCEPDSHTALVGMIAMMLGEENKAAFTNGYKSPLRYVEHASTAARFVDYLSAMLWEPGEQKEWPAAMTSLCKWSCEKLADAAKRASKAFEDL